MGSCTIYCMLAKEDDDDDVMMMLILPGGRGSMRVEWLNALSSRTVPFGISSHVTRSSLNPSPSSPIYCTFHEKVHSERTLLLLFSCCTCSCSVACHASVSIVIKLGLALLNG